MDTIWQEYRNFIAPLLVVIALFSGLLITNIWLGRRKTTDNWRLNRQIFIIALWLIAALGLLLVLPLEASTRDQLIGLFGLVNRRLNRHLPEARRGRMKIRPQLIR